MTTTLEELANTLAEKVVKRDPSTTEVNRQLIYAALAEAYELGKQTIPTEEVKYPLQSKSELLTYARDLGNAQNREDKCAAEYKFSQNWIHLSDKANLLHFSDEEIKQLKSEYIHGYALVPKA